MAVKRAIMFRKGSNGLICAAYEVAIEQGTETKQGTIRPIRNCTNFTTEVVQNTGLCASCAVTFRNSPQISVVQRTERG